MRVDPSRWLNLTIVVGLLAMAVLVILRGSGGTLPDTIAGGLLGTWGERCRAGTAPGVPGREELDAC